LGECWHFLPNFSTLNIFVEVLIAEHDWLEFIVNILKSVIVLYVFFLKKKDRVKNGISFQNF
jgi:hypothetical protein